MAKTLFLFSKTFPFGSGEQYVENELPVIAQYFDEIFIYPTDWFSSKEDHSRKLPANTRVLNFNSQLPSHRNTIFDYFITAKYVLRELSNTKALLSELKRVRYLFGVALHQLYTARYFKKYLQEHHEANTCFFYGYWNHASSIMLSMLKKEKFVQSFVTRAHSIDLYYYDWTYYEFKVPPFEFSKFDAADRIFTVSEHASRFFKNKYPKWQNKVACSYLGISDLGINELPRDVFTIVTCSNLSLNKRLLELAKAIQLLDFPLHWIHFGEGEQREDIEKIAKALPTHQKISLAGNTPNEEVRKYLVEKPVSLFVNISIVEGLPVAAMEAVSAGIPVIATEVYGNPEIAVNNFTGFTIPVDFKPEALASKIRKVYEDPALQEKFRKNARALYHEKFNDKKNYSEFSQEVLKYPNTFI